MSDDRDWRATSGPKRTIALCTYGIRRDLDDFFKLNFPGEVEPHNPYLVVTVDEAAGNVVILAKQKREDVLLYPDDTMVLKQWPGKWHSDFFQFTVGKLKAEIAKNGG